MCVADMGSGSDLYYPPPLSSNVFEPAYSAGARIHSDSWGTVSNMYDDTCIDIDQYHLTRPYFLALFAAGNEVKYYTTIIAIKMIPVLSSPRETGATTASVVQAWPRTRCPLGHHPPAPPPRRTSPISAP